MNTIIRWIFGHLVMLPFFFHFFIVSLCIGRKRAAGKTGKLLTSFSALWTSSAIPKMDSSKDFIGFKRRLIKNFMAYKFLYDIDVCEDTDGKVAFKINNCPFTSALKDYGAKELCRYACAGDFKVAKNNTSNWNFKRTHSHGTDGQCCNPAYFVMNDETQ